MNTKSSIRKRKNLLNQCFTEAKFCYMYSSVLGFREKHEIQGVRC